MLKIIPMQKADLEAVYNLERASFSAPKDISMFLAEQSKYFVAKGRGDNVAQALAPAGEGQIIGYIGFEEVAGEGHIVNMAVAPELRRKGVAKALVEYILDKSQVKVFFLEVRKSNLAAQKLYQGFNFKVVGRRKAYYQDNQEDALIMKLER